MSSLMQLAILGVVAFIVTLLLVPLVRRLAVSVGAVDYPSSRRMNKRPMQRLGGVAMFGGVVAAMAMDLLGEQFFGWKGIITQSTLQLNYPMLVVGLGLMCLVGAVDDAKNLKPLVKLGGQVVAAAVIALSGVVLGQLETPFFEDAIVFGPWSVPITVIYLVGFANMINLLDGIDGLAAGVVGIAAFSLFIIAFGGGRLEPALFGVILFAACLAFLRFNFYPASIYMGDSGALFLGTVLGVVSLMCVMRTPTLTFLLAPVVIAGVPTIDTAYAIIRRLRHHQHVDQADMGHLHHLLVKNGVRVPRATLLIYGWTVLLAIGGLAMSSSNSGTALLMLVVMVLLSGIFLFMIASYLPRRYWKRIRAQAEEEQRDFAPRGSAAFTVTSNDKSTGESNSMMDNESGGGVE